MRLRKLLEESRIRELETELKFREENDLLKQKVAETELETELKLREENELLKRKVPELETSRRSTPILSCRSTPSRITCIT